MSILLVKSLLMLIRTESVQLLQCLDGKLEKTLEQQHEENRAAYIAASKAYHNTLKDLYLADRLPGRIYDDMSHILQDLTPENQVS